MKNIFENISKFITDNMLITVIVIAAVVIVLALIIVAIIMSSKKGKNKNSTEKIKTSQGVRYSVDKNISSTFGEVNVTHNKGDFILVKGRIYKTRPGSNLLPGQYTILSTSEDVTKFNIRIAGFVRECSHGSAIILGDGDEICAVSHNVVLR